LAGVVLAPALLVWLWGGTAGVLFGSGWPHVGAAGLARLLLAVPGHLDDPRAAWPRALRGGLPGPDGFYAAFGLLIIASAAVVVGLFQIRRRTAGERAASDAARGAAQWANAHDLGALRSKACSREHEAGSDRGGRLALGWSGRRLLRAEERHALVVFGPPQSGKSAGLAVGAVLEWDGPAIVSSIKTDVLQTTIEERRRRGRVFVFDPFGLSTETCSGWSPLAGAFTFDGALEVAHRLASAAEVDQRSVESGDFWTVAAEQRLAPLLYAAARSGKGVPALVRWAYGQGEHELAESLDQCLRSAHSDRERRSAQAAYDAAAGFRSQPDRTRGSIEGTVQALLRAYRSERVQRSARSVEIAGSVLLAGDQTLYLVGDAKASRLLRPVFLALLGELVDHAYLQANRNGGRLARPLLLCLDELGNVAPLPNLAEIASTAPSHNIQLVSVFHDLAQARARYGRQAETVINSHRARMLLPGVADLDTLRYFSGLIGDAAIRERTQTTGAGYQTRSESHARRPLAPPERLRQLPEGHALLVYGRLPPAIIRLRMWFADRRLRRLAEAR
jgi:type IV secretory pathway TraG/TraD family ATPase VirD4